MKPVGVMLLVTQVLEALGVRYFVGGSIASSAYGEERSTRDVDIITALGAQRARPFVEALEADFYAQLAEVQEAIARAPSMRCGMTQFTGLPATSSTGRRSFESICSCHQVGLSSACSSSAPSPRSLRLTPNKP